MATIYIVSNKQSIAMVDALNEKDIWIEEVGHYLDKKQVKAAAKVKDLRSVSGVYVSESRRGRVPHNTIQYNEEYRKLWGNQPLYGNVVIVLSDKAYKTLPAEFQMTDEQVKAIVL